MFQRILVPVDLTEKNQRAVQIASEYRAQNGSDVTLLHVIETIEHVPFDELQDFYANIEKQARDGIEALARAFPDGPGSVERAIVYGHRVEAIVDHARRQGTDLIVMSSHQVDDAHPARGWATISHLVAMLAPCPVLLVK